MKDCKVKSRSKQVTQPPHNGNPSQQEPKLNLQTKPSPDPAHVASHATFETLAPGTTSNQVYTFLCESGLSDQEISYLLNLFHQTYGDVVDEN